MVPSPLNAGERERYARHILLKEIGGPGQQRLKAASVAIVGLGGLGAPAALYLAAAGVGRLGLIDHDQVALSNLQRQILYGTADVAQYKTDAARARLASLNPHVELDCMGARLVTPHNTEAQLAGYEIVLDGTDDFSTRFLVNETCHRLGSILISGAVGRWDGQVSTFKSGITKHLAPELRLPCYRCLVPDIPPHAERCEEVGIIGALPGIIGSMMALEAVKEITEAGDTLAGRLLVFDGLAATARTIALKRDPACPVCGDG